MMQSIPLTRRQPPLTHRTPHRRCWKSVLMGRQVDPVPHSTPAALLALILQCQMGCGVGWDFVQRQMQSVEERESEAERKRMRIDFSFLRCTIFSFSLAIFVAYCECLISLAPLNCAP